VTLSYIKGIVVAEQRKQAVSIRLGDSDIRNIKRIANRLGVRDSDIIRFAIKSTLNRVAPLCDQAIRGRNLVPVLVESGDELIRYFELDAFRLESIINEHVDESRQVDRDDIALLAMSGLRDEYLVMRLKDGEGGTNGSSAQTHSLRRYLYDKYVYRSGDHTRSTANGRAVTRGHAATNGPAEGNGSAEGNGHASPNDAPAVRGNGTQAAA
jgi:hypothetical protein